MLSAILALRIELADGFESSDSTTTVIARELALLGLVHSESRIRTIGMSGEYTIYVYTFTNDGKRFLIELARQPKENDASAV